MRAIQRFRSTSVRVCVAACLTAASFAPIARAQEATTPPAPTTAPTPVTVPSPTDVPESTNVPAAATPPLSTEILVRSDGISASPPVPHSAAEKPLDFSSMLFVFMLATIIGLGVIMRVSRLLHTPLMSLTNAISAIAVVGAILVTGNESSSQGVRILGVIALFASMTNIVSGFMITDRMLKMFKSPGEGGKR
jgi:H+-translocating NAD(P) transhydrogenase subunit alpha